MSLPKRQIRDSIRALVPPWLADRGATFANTGFKLLYSIGATIDGLTEWMVQGMQADMPGIGTPTALPYLVRDRRIIRGREEADAAISDRLNRWLDAWRNAGHPHEICRQIRGYFGNAIKVRTVDNSGNWHTIAADGTESRHHIPGSWDWDGNSLTWARLWVIIYAPPSWAQWTAFYEVDPDLWGGDFTGEPYTWDQELPANVDVVADVREIVRRWKPRHAFVPNIIVSYNALQFDPENPDTWPLGTWGTPVVGSPPEPSRPADASFWEGVD